ncbi:hypothetical protein [Roseateles aquatilis]|uniref:hypothetical protein n=1 Tax=Roseateles aquatilis TaxID=431061 RepID=UPI001130D63E|nr:hypothetical protein [Roseateles aquatilis]
MKHSHPSARDKTKRQRSVLTVLVLLENRKARKFGHMWGVSRGGVYTQDNLMENLMHTAPPPVTQHIPNRERFLIVDALLARRHYLLEALELLMRYGTLRVQGLAFGLFPNRSQPAALAAAQRVVANAVHRGFMVSADDAASRFRYYALSAAGARFIRDEGGTDTAAPTTYLLRKLTRAHHREWTNICSIAARRRGLESYAETDYLGQSFRADLNERFGHIPDALTFADLGNRPTVVWHEIELSRRSMRNLQLRPLKPDEQDNSGIGKWRQLLHTLRQRCALTHQGIDHRLMLVVHCASSTLLSILAKHLGLYAEQQRLPCHGGLHFTGGEPAPAQATANWASFALPFESRGAGMLEVRLYRLPEGGVDPGKVWHDSDSFPWQNVDEGFELDEGYNEQFMVP